MDLDMNQEENTSAEQGKDIVPFKINDRVRRRNSRCCAGVVQEVRKELAATSVANNETASWMVRVLWDNGTSSYFDPSSLEQV